MVTVMLLDDPAIPGISKFPKSSHERALILTIPGADGCHE